MSTLLSPPSQGQSPAHDPNRGQPAGSSGASSVEISPRRILGIRGRTLCGEEEDRVFFMEDLDTAGDVTSISREPRGYVATPKESARPVQRKPASRPDPVRNGWFSETTSEQPCPQPRNLNTHCHTAKRPSCTSAPGSEPLPYTNGWEMGLEGTASETAEVIAHRMGGMKLSATVIFNPHSPSLTELAVDKLLLPRPTPSEIEPCGPLVATHCLLNSCVCCGSCEDGHEDTITTETTGLGLGLALGLDKQCTTPASSTVIQSSACRLPPRPHEHHSKDEMAQLCTPTSRCSAESLDGAPGLGHQTQDCSSSVENGAFSCNHQLRTEKRHVNGGQQGDKEMVNEHPESKDMKKYTKEDSRRSSRCVAVSFYQLFGFTSSCCLCGKYELHRVASTQKSSLFSVLFLP